MVCFCQICTCSVGWHVKINFIWSSAIYANTQYNIITLIFLPRTLSCLFVCSIGRLVMIFSRFYIIGTHSNNVLIWFTKRILGTVFLWPFSVCPKWLSITSSQKTTTPIDPVFCHHTAYSRPTKRCFWISINICICWVIRISVVNFTTVSGLQFFSCGLSHQFIPCR